MVADVKHHRGRRSLLVVPHLHQADVLVDAMRGRFTTWTRVRVNLQHVPLDLRPDQEPLDPDEDPVREWRKRQGGKPPETQGR